MLYQAPPPQSFITKPLTVIQKPAEKPKAPEPVLYTIKDGDVLEKVASDQHTTVQKLFNKNTVISDPNIIEVGQTLVIPTDSETLTERPLPVTIQTDLSIARRGTAVTGGSSSSGNLYSPGYCTYGVKEWRPDLPNNLGNADTWYSNAAAQGLAVGSAPRVGAVAAAISYMHVALVLEVHGNTILIKEMNYKGLWVVSTREAPISEFHYIY